MHLAGQTRPPKTVKTPWPAWAEWRPNQLWCWDASQFERCQASKHAYGIIDLVSRKWITVTLTPEPNAVSVRVLFLKALAAENLLTAELEERLADPQAAIPDDIDELPMLVAISDNGTEMRAGDTRKFMALLSIAQHFGRPSTPTDQAWIETLWGHLKWEHPHLMAITDPAVLAAELERLRQLYNTVRLSLGDRELSRDVA
jgi:putative transposase